MADNVIVSPSASYTVSAEDIGASVEVQRIKVVLGTAGVDGGNVGLTNPMPVTGTVTVLAGLSVSAQVSGTVSVSGAVQVSGAVSVSALPAVSISVSAVLGTVNTVLGTVAVNVVAGGAAPGTTAATQSAISAQVVWLAPTQTINATVNTIAAGFSVNALVTGVVSVSVLPAVSISVSAALGTVITVLGTVAVNVVAGGAAPGTTAATQSAISAQVVWLAPTQTINATVNTIAAGFSVNALVTGVVSVSVLPAVSISVSAALGTVITILGTQVVSVVPGVSVNALVTGVVSISVLPAVSISVSAALGTVITILGTQVVTVAGLKFTTATPTVTETGPVVWLANTVTVTVTATVTGSLIISGITPVTTQASVSVSGLPVWMSPTQGVTILGVVSVDLGVSETVGTIIAVSGVTAVSVVSTIVTILGTQLAREAGAQAVMIVVTSTAGVVSATVYNFTIWTGAIGAPAAAGTTSWAVPAGKTIRFQNIQAAINSSAVTGGTVQVFLCAAGATGSHVSASVSTQMQLLKLQVLVSAGPVAASLIGNFQDVGAATSIAVFGVGSTAYNIQQVVILGYMF